MKGEQGSEVKFRSPKRQVGYAQVWHVLTLDKGLSDQAYRLYALLLKYAQQKDNAYPTVETLADELGKKERSVLMSLKELVINGLISREKRPGTSTMTWIEEIDIVYKQELEILLKERDKRYMQKNAPTTCKKMHPNKNNLRKGCVR